MSKFEDENKLLQAALWYIKQGWPVLPLHTPYDKKGACSCGVRHTGNDTSAGKHPRTAHGVREASTDKATVLDWWRQWPDANVGIATGHNAGIMVLDVDARHGGDESLARLLAKHGPLADVPEVLTGSGSWHFFFRCDEETKNTAGVIGDGIDTRASGGYVVAAPSLHMSGKRYEWKRRPRPKEVLPYPPEWMAVRQSVKVAVHSEGPVLEGSRNNALTSLAGAMRKQGCDADTIFAGIMHFNIQRCVPPLDEREVRNIANSMLRYDPAPEAIGAGELSQLGNADRLVLRHGQDLRFTDTHGWLVWNGKVWQRDRIGEVKRRAVDTVRSMPLEATVADDEEQRKALLKWAKASQSAANINAMVDLAKDHISIATRSDVFDRNNWLLTVNNGTLDLKSGKLLPHSREDFITKYAPVTFDPSAECPRFLRFLRQIMDGQQALIDYLQRLIGYTLTGQVTESILPIMYGQGSNGKTTLLTVIQDLLGPELSGAAPPGLLMAKRGESHPTELADLQGKRLVVASETGSGKAMAIEIMKQLTGGDKIKGRFMRQDFFEFTATHKIYLLTNHKPVIRDLEYAVWRRVKLIPFTVTISGKRIDKELGAKLAAEKSGILNWALAGCLEWQANGLQDPPEVQAATRTYREESDVLADFIADCCYLQTSAKTSVATMYRTYEAWARQSGEKAVMSKTSLGRRLMARSEITQAVHKNMRFWFGVGIKNTNIVVKGADMFDPEADTD